VLIHQGQYDKAHSSIRRAIRLDRISPQPRIVLAELRAARRNYRGAERALNKALARAPNSPQVFWAFCKLYEKQGKTDQSVACMKKIFALNPTNAKIHIRISNQYNKAGRLAEATQALLTALALEPLPATYHNLSEVLDAQSLKAEAIAAMSAACKLDPDNKEYRLRLAKLAAGNAVETTAVPNIRVEPASRSNLSIPARSIVDRIRRFLRASKDR